MAEWRAWPSPLDLHSRFFKILAGVKLPSTSPSAKAAMQIVMKNA